MYQHRVSVTGTDGKTRPDLNKAIGAHYNGPGHKVSDVSVTILEKVYSKDPMVLVYGSSTGSTCSTPNIEE